MKAKYLIFFAQVKLTFYCIPLGQVYIKKDLLHLYDLTSCLLIEDPHDLQLSQ